MFTLIKKFEKGPLKIHFLGEFFGPRLEFLELLPPFPSGWLVFTICNIASIKYNVIIVLYNSRNNSGFFLLRFLIIILIPGSSAECSVLLKIQSLLCSPLCNQLCKDTVTRLDSEIFLTTYFSSLICKFSK